MPLSDARKDGCDREAHRPLTAICPDSDGAAWSWQGGGLVRAGRSLERGELRGLFGEEERFEVLVDREGELFTGGAMVPAAFFAARRRR